MNVIGVKHNIEVAHRLLTPGKCEAIHGHSMQVTMKLLGGSLNERGMFEGLDYGGLKKAFREYLDENFDHRVLLNAEDVWSKPFFRVSDIDRSTELSLADDDRLQMSVAVEADQMFLPGLRAVEGDPTTENIAREIHQWAWTRFVEAHGLTHLQLSVEVWETATNMAEVIM